MKLSKLATDGKLAVEGVWEDIGEGFEVLVARMNNPKYRAYMRKIVRTKTRSARRVGTDIDQMIELQQEGAVRHLLLDWKGLEDDAGKNIPYTLEKARELFGTHPDLYDLIIEISSDAELFRLENQEETSGNSLTSSSGSSSGESS